MQLHKVVKCPQIHPRCKIGEFFSISEKIDLFDVFEAGGACAVYYDCNYHHFTDHSICCLSLNISILDYRHTLLIIFIIQFLVFHKKIYCDLG